MFEIELLQASEGDCVLLHYGDPLEPTHTLIDTGRQATWPALKARLDAIHARGEILELLVISHVDRDHIEGVLQLMKDPIVKQFGDIWFNGYHHLQNQTLEAFGALQGEALTQAIVDQHLPWNKHVKWNRGPVALPTPAAPVTLTLDSELKITLLSPTLAQLSALKGEWEAACEDAHVVPGHAVEERRELEGFERFGAVDINALADSAFKQDSAKPNGSSIAFIAEFEGKRALLGADAHPGQLVAALDALGGRQSLAAFKVPHHGSRANLSRELLQRVTCQDYLVSTNGSYFKHPDREAIARIVKYGGTQPRIHFNYTTPQNEIWKDAGLQQQFTFDPRFPPAAATSVTLTL